MRDNPLHLVFASRVINPNHFPDAFNCLFRLFQLGMRTLEFSRPIIIMPYPLLARDNSAVVTAIAAQIHPFARCDAQKRVDVAVDMARRVDDVQTSIMEEVDCAREWREGLPGMPLCLCRCGHVFPIRICRRREFEGLGGRDGAGFDSVERIVWGAVSENV